MPFNFNVSFGTSQAAGVEPTLDRGGHWFYKLFSGNGNVRSFKSEQEKINTILSNPACLKVFAINCDLFSLGKINTSEVDDYLRTLRKTPNYKQTWTQFYWDYMFWVMTGTAYLWKTGGRLLDGYNTLQFLNPAKIEWTPSTLEKLMDLILTKAKYSEVTKQTIKYNFGNGKYKYIPLSEITPIHDLSSTVNDNFYKGISRIDALYKIISNSEQALDAKGINLEFSRKWVVSGMNNPDDTTKLPMNEEEKNSIREKVRSGVDVFPMKTPIDIKRFTDNMANLKLDEAYATDYYNIGSMFNIPRDILEMYNAKGSTFENQEKSIVRHIEYVLKPKGKELTNALEDILDIQDTDMHWSHLACYQVFEAERQAVIQLKLNNAILAKQNDINIDDL